MDKEVYEYISKQPCNVAGQASDPIVEWKVCAISGKGFPIFQSDLDFYEKISPTFAGKKYKIPTPTLCPEERSRRRMMFRNERKLYHTNCAFSQKPILSIYEPSKGYTVYDNDIRRSDKRDALDYGQDIDFSRSFTEQFSTLLKNVPHPAVFNANSQNSLYCNHVGDMKNAYLTAASWDCEDIMYSSKCLQVKDCIDAYETFESELCYQTIECEKCYKLQRSQQCENCNESYFLFDCHNCNHCFGCWNLVGKQYYFFNQKLEKEEYYKKIQKYIGSRTNMENIQKQRIKELQNQTIYKPFQALNSENCRGNRISNAQNCYICYNLSELQDCKYCENGAQGVKDTQDGFGMGMQGSLGYEIIDTGVHSERTCFTAVVHGCNNIYYSRNCEGSSNLFGCVGLVNQNYCIFNKQYSKEEYEKLVSKIIKHMIETKERGEFFDPSLSPFTYNESIAQENYPLTHNKALKRGYSWFDGSRDAKAPVGADIIQGKDLPDSIDKIDDNICSKIVICSESSRPFKIQPTELVFYKRNNIPLPDLHPDLRHLARIKKKAGREMYLRKCDKCGIEMLSVYKKETLFNKEGGEGNHAPQKCGGSTGDSKGEETPLTPFSKGGIKVYCEECYNKEVYG